MNTASPLPDVALDNTGLLAEVSAGKVSEAALLDRLADVRSISSTELALLNTLIRLWTRVSSTLDLNVILTEVVSEAVRMLGAERGTLFLYDEQRNEFFSRATVGDVTTELRFGSKRGIVAHVFRTGVPFITNDAYSDPIFNSEVDKTTGFVTKSTVCVPISTRTGARIGVLQILNRESGFVSHDVLLLQALAIQAASALSNAWSHEQLERARETEKTTQEISAELMGEIHLPALLQKIMAATTALLNAERSTLFVYDREREELWSQVVDGGGLSEIRIPLDKGIAAEAFKTGRVINIPDAYSDPRFNQEVDRKSNFRTRSILCMPVLGRDGKSVAVMQVLNKADGPFTVEDEDRFRAFAGHAAVALENASLFEEVLNIKNYNENILESLTNGVITLDQNGTIVTCNAASARILGAGLADLHHKSIKEYFGEANSWVAESVANAVRRDAPEYVFDTDLKTAGGTISVNLSCVPLKNVSNESIGSMIVFEDITREKRIKSTMTRYMAKEVAERLLTQGEAMLGGQAHEATIFFSDIRGFTSLAEQMGATETVAMLNDYFAVMVDVILDNRGILDKYIGDAIMAVFGAPFSSGADADNAIRAGVEMLKALRTFNARRASAGKSPIEIAIGVNTAEVLSGSIGSLKRMEYTVIGDGVNLAARLESLNRHYGTNLLVSEFTLAKAQNKYLLREVDLIRVKGKAKPVSVFEILGYHESDAFGHLERTLDLYNSGIASYKDRRWKEAAESFKAAAALIPQDGPTNVFLKRCEQFVSSPPDNDWDGIWVMHSK